MAPIENVLILGGTGSIGTPIVSALLSSHPHKFNVSVYTRSKAKAKLPPSVTVIEGDYEPGSLASAFRGQDAVISALATVSATDHAQQKTIIDAAIGAGVKRYVPSEFGLDTSEKRAEEAIPPIGGKREVIKYIRSREESISWTGVVVGAFFDWALEKPGLLGFDIPGRKATIYDDGNERFEATNLAQIGAAVAASLTPEHYDETANTYIFVNSFSVTQNEVLSELEKAIGSHFTVEKANGKEAGDAALEELKIALRDGVLEDVGGALYPKGALPLIMCALVAGYGGLNRYREKGLWNGKLGLPEERLVDTIVGVVKGFQK